MLQSLFWSRRTEELKSYVLLPIECHNFLVELVGFGVCFAVYPVTIWACCHLSRHKTIILLETNPWNLCITWRKEDEDEKKQIHYFFRGCDGDLLALTIGGSFLPASGLPFNSTYYSWCLLLKVLYLLLNLIVIINVLLLKVFIIKRNSGSP